MAALITDRVISFVADFLSDRISTGPGVFLFVLISAISFLGQFFILSFIKNRARDLFYRSRYLDMLHKAVSVIQYLVIAVFISLIFEIVFTGHYNTSYLIFFTVVGYTTNAVLLALVAQQLLSAWYRSIKEKHLLAGTSLLLFAIGSIAMLTTYLVTTASDLYHLSEKQMKSPAIDPKSKVVFPSSWPAGTFLGNIHEVYRYADLMSFLFMWSGAVLLLRYHFKRISQGTRKYWILMILPLVYYLSTSIDFFNLYTPKTDSDQFYYFLYGSMNPVAGGILIGLAFRTVAQSIHRNSPLRDYLTIAGYGILLVFVLGQPSVIEAPYPPFGVVMFSFMGLAGYLLFVGLYCSGMSLSQDVRLYNSIKRSATEESKLLVGIGASQIEKKIESKVLTSARQQQLLLVENTGVQSSITESEMRNYLYGVLKEIKVLQSLDEIIGKGREILDSSSEFLVCSKPSGLRLAYNNYFSSYERAMLKHAKREHEGVRIVTTIDNENKEIVKNFLNIGVQIRHIKNIPPIDFAVSDKEMIATIERVEQAGHEEVAKSLLVTNEIPYIEHFTSIFEDLWKNGIDGADRITDIEQGIDLSDIEIIQNPAEGLKRAWSLIRMARMEISMMFATADAFRVQLTNGMLLELLKEITGRYTNNSNFKVRILLPADPEISDILRYIDKRLPLSALNIRVIEESLRTKIMIILVDNKECLIIESKDNPRVETRGVGAGTSPYNTVGLSTYSNSKPIVNSYASIFASLWKQTELYEQLKVHDKMQKEFINVAAHELRTPITPLLFSSDELKKMMPEEELISIVNRNAKKLQRLANDILDVTRIEGHRLVLTKSTLNLNDLLMAALKDVQNQFVEEGGGSELHFEFQANEIFFIEGDRDRLGQVVSNLLGNALKFTKKGSILISATRNNLQKQPESETTKSEVIVRVKDTGAGIDSEILPRLFTKFATKSDTGTGLGLYISKNIIESHDGRIWAQNNVDGEKGAIFGFSLPIM